MEPERADLRKICLKKREKETIHVALFLLFRKLIMQDLPKIVFMFVHNFYLYSYYNIYLYFILV